MKDVCPACGDARVTVVYTQRQVPVNQNLVMSSESAARGITRGDLRLGICDNCCLVSNLAFDPALLTYTGRYDNNQNGSPRFDAHVEERLQRVSATLPPGATVVEVGCGKGYFIRRLCEGKSFHGFGYDTSYVGPDVEPSSNVQFFRRYFGGGGELPAIDAVVCRHVIEHVPNPVHFLREIGRALRPDYLTRLSFETPSLEWILDGGVFWDFFYEHCCYFTKAALRNMFVIAGFGSATIDRVFEGQYLWLEADSKSARQDSLDGVDAAAQSLGASLAGMQQRQHRWSEQIESLAKKGHLAIWGAGAKGVTFVNLMDADASKISVVVDINPNKMGRHVPGTGHRIVGPESLRSEGITDVVIMNPNYLQESIQMAAAHDASPRFFVAE